MDDAQGLWLVPSWSPVVFKDRNMRSIVFKAAITAGEHISTLPSLNDLETIVNIIGNAVTALAIIVGGVWAYFRFVKGRTYRMRAEVQLSGGWSTIDSANVLHARVSIKNIGASKVALTQRGTGLRVSAVGASQAQPPISIEWQSLAVFSIFKEHEWVEPDETISDELLLDIDAPQPTSVLFEARLILRRSWPRKNVAVFARRVIGANSTVETDHGNVTIDPEGKRDDGS